MWREHATQANAQVYARPAPAGERAAGGLAACAL
jgi:hypothetical protein